jgi:hypothetical protein
MRTRAMAGMLIAVTTAACGETVPTDPLGMAPTAIWTQEHTDGAGVAVATAQDGSIAVVGTLEVLEGGYISRRGAWVRHRSSNGTENWFQSSEQANGAGDDVAIASDGSVLMAAFDQPTAFLWKYDAAGSLGWSQTAQFTLGSASVAVGGNREVYFLAASSMSSGQLVKYDPAGALLWSQPVGVAEHDESGRVACDAAGTVATTIVGFDPGGSQPCSVLRVLDASGNELWTDQGCDWFANDLVMDDDSLVVAGSGTGGSFFLRKYDRMGAEQWTRSEPGSAQNEWNGVALAPAGTIVVGGRSSTTASTRPRVMAYDANGEVTWSWSGAGLAASAGGAVEDVAVGPSGQIIVVGGRDARGWVAAIDVAHPTN